MSLRKKLSFSVSRGKEKLKVCPDRECRLKMRASNLVRHIKTKHPGIDQEKLNK